MEEAVERINGSVIIPSHNRAPILQRVLDYYTLQSADRRNFEVVVIDDGSVDETPSIFAGFKIEKDLPEKKLARYLDRIIEVRSGWYSASVDEGLFIGHESFFIRYVRIKKSGRSVARNVGINMAVFPLIIFADDDIFVEGEFVEKHLYNHSHDDRLVVMGKVIHTQDLENPFVARWKLKDINTAFLSTGNASVLKKYIVEAGMFDEKYSAYGWEDFDLGIHLKEMGIRSVKRDIFGYHYSPPEYELNPGAIYSKEKERGFTAVYFYINHSLKWVKRFTLVNNQLLKALFNILGMNNWFLSRKRIRYLKGIVRLIIRYKGYFDGIDEGKKYFKL